MAAEQGERLRVEDLETRPTEDGKAREPDPRGIVQRWLAEIDLASEQEREWRKEAEEIWKRYRAEKALAAQQNAYEASFNILWANTEIIVPALYNTSPTPDVRRRFKEGDPLGKLTGMVLERALSYAIDSYDFDDEVISAVLDFALVGRGGARIRYRPTVREVPVEENADAAAPPPETAPVDSEQVRQAEPMKRITAQDTVIEHFDWKDFRRGPGKRWSQVPWVAFRHDMTYDDLVEYFGEEVAQRVPLVQLSESESETLGKDDRVKRLFQTGEVWEIWDKLQRRVLFIARGVDEPLYLDDNPTLQLRGFFPMPRPMMAFLDSTSLVPVPLYRQYRSQAAELDRLTRRIEKITNALRIRGIYISNVREVPSLMEAGDNEFIPVEDAGAIAQVGLDKLIWIMPVDKLIQMLEGLYRAREQMKLTIYEIIGLSDIMRGATKATETLGAQELKSKWGSVRLQRMQKEVQRWVRDILRLKGEVIAEHYEPEILAEMTQIRLPTMGEKQAAQLQLQQMMLTLPPGQPPPSPPPELKAALELPTWEEVIAVLRSDTMRQYRVNIETDSTVRELIDSDMQGLSEVLGALGNVFGALPVLTQGGAQNAPETIKEIALTVVRHARMGRTVEDAIENLDFGPGQSEIMHALQQLQQQMQQGLQQLQQIGQRVQQHEQMIGQIVRTMQAAPGAAQRMPAPPQPSPQPPTQLAASTA